MDCTEIYTISEMHKVDLIRLRRNKHREITPERIKWVDEKSMLHDLVVDRLVDRSNHTMANYRLGVSGIRYIVDVTDINDVAGAWNRTIALYDDGNDWFIDPTME